jgi:hypothetical protein
MKKVVVFFTFLSLTLMSWGQANRAGNVNVNLGMGFSPTYFEEGAEVEIVPLHLSIDYSIFSLLSVGAHVNLSSSVVDEVIAGNTFQLATSYNTLGLRANGHLPLGDQIDLYLGGVLGFQRVAEAYREDPITQVAVPEGLETARRWDLRPEGHLGIRLRFAENLGIYAEGGYGLSIFQAGFNMLL